MKALKVSQAHILPTVIVYKIEYVIHRNRLFRLQNLAAKLSHRHATPKCEWLRLYSHLVAIVRAFALHKHNLTVSLVLKGADSIICTVQQLQKHIFALLENNQNRIRIRKSEKLSTSQLKLFFLHFTFENV